VLSLPAFARLLALPPEARAALRDVLRALALDARAKAETSWRRHKGPMAAYWRAVSVYAAHIARGLR
jgi:hypothetical protein